MQQRVHYGRLTDRVGDTVTVAFGMGHMVLRVDHIVPYQLYGFGVDDLGVVVFHHRFHQVLVNQSSEGAPLVAIMHDQ